MIVSFGTKETEKIWNGERMKKLPIEEVQEIADFAQLLLRKHEDKIVIANIQALSSESSSFQFLAEEEEVVYQLSDLKERYDG